MAGKRLTPGAGANKKLRVPKKRGDSKTNEGKERDE